MSNFTTYTIDNAPKASKELIKQSVATYSFLPNLHGVLAESPAAYEGYLKTFELFEKQSSFSPLEQQVVFMTANYTNDCHYCVPGHSMLMKMNDMSDDVIEALREGKPLPNASLEALRTYAKRLLDKRGHLSDAELKEFFDAGYTKQQALDVMVGLASKLISNFTNAIADTDIDEPVKAFAWTHPDKRNQAA